MTPPTLARLFFLSLEMSRGEEDEETESRSLEALFCGGGYDSVLRLLAWVCPRARHDEHRIENVGEGERTRMKRERGRWTLGRAAMTGFGIYARTGFQ